MQAWLNEHQGLLALLALIAAILLGTGAIFATRIWGERRGRLLVSIDATAVEVPSGLSNSLEITSDGHRVMEPLIALIEIANVGPRDLPTSAFDSSKPIGVHIPGAMPVTASVNRDDVSVSVNGDEVRVGPAHLPRGASWLVHVLYDGVPSGDPEVRAAVVDFDVSLGSRSQLRQQLVEVFISSTPFPLSTMVRLAVASAGARRS